MQVIRASGHRKSRFLQGENIGFDDWTVSCLDAIF